MPELPEVETIRRTLAPRLTGRVVREVQVATPAVWRRGDPAALPGCRVLGVGRRGKHLLIPLERPDAGGAGGGAGLVLHVHLGMTGRLLFVPRGGPLPECHLHARLAFDGGELCYQDTRRFGYLEVLPPEALEGDPGLRLGPEPLDPPVTARRLREVLAGRRAPVKAVLLDQRVLAGVGNIYADEALHRAGVNPLRPAGELGEGEVAAVAEALREVLEEAIAARGTTFSDYRDGEGRPGGFGPRLRVYGREGEPCPRCGHPVTRGRLGGRSTYFCPCCQK